MNACRVLAVGVGIETQRRSLAEQAYTQLVHAITRLELAPGEVLVDKVLVGNLGIGRTPVREALQRLAVEGLVVHLPNRGMFVTEITAASVQNIYEFRALIDGHAARLAATRATPDEVDELHRLHLALVEATDDGDVERYVEMDRGFYEVLAEAARNVYLAETIPRIFNLHLRLWFFISARKGGWSDIASAHDEMTRDVVAAIRARDPEEAESAMRTYIAGRHDDARGLL